MFLQSIRNPWESQEVYADSGRELVRTGCYNDNDKYRQLEPISFCLFKEDDGLSKLDDALEKHGILSIVEQRPFSYMDFREFKVDGNSHRMAHGTFRNKVSVLMKKGIR